MDRLQMTPENMVTAIARTLEAWSRPENSTRLDSSEWRQGGGVRTSLMKGNAIRGDRGCSARNRYVLGDVLEEFGYVRWGSASRRVAPERIEPRVYFHERHGLDIVAVESPESWDTDCWRGQYRTRLTLELENDIQKFTMTMRGLLNVRADLHCGIFYGNEAQPLRVGATHHGESEPRRRIPLEEWEPPWSRRDEWSVPLHPRERLVAIFLSADEPRVLAAKCYEPDGRATSLP